MIKQVNAVDIEGSIIAIAFSTVCTFQSMFPLLDQSCVIKIMFRFWTLDILEDLIYPFKLAILMAKV